MSCLSSHLSALFLTFPSPRFHHHRLLHFHLLRPQPFPLLLSPKPLLMCSTPPPITSCGPPTPGPDHPLANVEDPSTGLKSTFYRIQDRVRIFFAVLFWMTLFFWSSAWDAGDNIRPKRGSRFRR